MTTTYKTVNYETHEALRDAINAELETLAYPYTVKHKFFGEGQLTSVKAPCTGADLHATIDFASGNKMVSLGVIFAANLLTMPEILAGILLEAQNAFNTDYLGREQEKREADRLAALQAREAAERAAAEKKAEAKYKQQKEKALRDFDRLAERASELSDVDEFYYSLGWLAKHVGVITAKLPDYLGSAFEKHFGADAPKTLVDSRAKTIGGYAKQWSWEFVASIKKLKETTVPAYLQGTTTDFSKGIHNTSFVWDLVDNYGFQFGNKQDIEKIKQTIPTDFIPSFEAGLTA